MTSEELIHSLKQSSLVYEKFIKEYPAFAEDNKMGKKRRMRRKSGKIKCLPTDAEKMPPSVDLTVGNHVLLSETSHSKDHKFTRHFKHKFHML